MIYIVFTQTYIEVMVLYYMGITNLSENLMKNMEPSPENQTHKYTKMFT